MRIKITPLYAIRSILNVFLIIVGAFIAMFAQQNVSIIALGLSIIAIGWSLLSAQLSNDDFSEIKRSLEEIKSKLQ